MVRSNGLTDFNLRIFSLSEWTPRVNENSVGQMRLLWKDEGIV